MSNLVYRRRFPIEWGHCDPAGIVFNARFFEFFDWSAWLLFEAALGVRPADWRRRTASSASRWPMPRPPSCARPSSTTW